MKKYTVKDYVANRYQIEKDILKQTRGIDAEYFRDEEKRPYIFYEKMTAIN